MIIINSKIKDRIKQISLKKEGKHGKFSLFLWKMKRLVALQYKNMGIHGSRKLCAYNIVLVFKKFYNYIKPVTFYSIDNQLRYYPAHLDLFNLHFLTECNKLNIIKFIFLYYTYTASWKSFASFCVHSPDLPLPIMRPSIFVTGINSAPVPVRKHSSAL